MLLECVREKRAWLALFCCHFPKHKSVSVKGCKANGSACEAYVWLLGYRRGDRERARVSRFKCWNQYTQRDMSLGLSPNPSLP